MLRRAAITTVSSCLRLLRGRAGAVIGGQALLTRDEARRIAANIAKLPELLRKP